METVRLIFAVGYNEAADDTARRFEMTVVAAFRRLDRFCYLDRHMVAFGNIVDQLFDNLHRFAHFHHTNDIAIPAIALLTDCNIEIDFATFLPSLGTFYVYFELLKEYKFIQDVQVVPSECGEPVLRVLRKVPEFSLNS